MNARILVIDDDASYRRVCALALKSVGFEVLTAEDGAQGVRALEAHRVDLVLTDILMPNSDGMETIMNLRNQFPAVRVVAMSGGGTFAAEECLRMARTLGASGVLRKPFSMEDLVRTVTDALPQTPCTG